MSAGDPNDRQPLRDEATEAARSAASGTRAKLDRFFVDRYEEMKSLAEGIAGPEGRSPSVSPTALVHLAYERLIDASQVTEKGSVYFRACFANVVRRLLVERARARKAQKRSGLLHRRSVFESADLPPIEFVDLVDLHEAMDRLAALPRNGTRMAKVVELRVFAGMTVPECADALGVSPRTIDNDWTLARAFLQEQLSSDG